jgi:threonine/homoserine/homoserine lactone efflux protein
MFEYLFLGGGFGFAAAVQPGPLTAFLLARVAERGWRPTLLACVSPLLSDGPIAILTLLLLRQLPEEARQALGVAGGALLLYLAWAALRRWRAPGASSNNAASPPRTLLQAALVNLANPGPYLGWSLVLGPAAIEAWGRGPAYTVALIAAFYGALVGTLALIIMLFGATGLLTSRVRRAITFASVLALAALGVYQLWAGLSG